MPAGPGTTFVGRRRELAALSAVVRTARDVTLTGAGGTGKTRLATALVPRIRHDRLVWVDLAPLREPSEVRAALAQALGLQSGGRSARELLVSALGGRRTLVVLDNCEHLLQASAELCASVLAASEKTRVLATSRTPLGIADEVVWRVPPLALPAEGAEPRAALASDAVRLFLDRARSARRRFAPDELGPADIAWICRRVDGLPLAIELAAARTRHMSVAELRARLDILPSLERGDADARHASMEKVIDWSHSLLGPADRLAFRRLSVFASDFSLAAAESVCGELPPGAAAGSATSLVDQSLLEFLPDVGRYRMLQPIRQYATRQLALNDEQELATSRCALDLFRRHVEESPPGVSSRRLDTEMRRDYANATAVLPWLIAHEPGYAVRLLERYAARHWTAVPVHLDVLEAWLARALAAYPTRDATRAEGLLSAVRIWSEVARGVGPREHGEALAGEALAVAIEIGDRRLELRARIARADLAVQAGSYERAVALYDEAVPSMQPRPRAMALSVRAVLKQHLEDRAGATVDLAAAFASWDAQPEHSASERSLTHLCAADIAYRRGDHALAGSHLRQAIQLRRDSGEPQGAAPFELLAHLAALGGDAERALLLDAYAERLRIETGHWPASFLALAERSWLPPLEGRFGARVRRLRDEVDRWTSARALAYALGERSPDGLTARERTVAQLIAGGMSDKEIAAHLGIAERTAENHVQHVREKLGCRSRVDVARRMAESLV